MCVFLCFYVLFAVCVNGPLWTDFQINGKFVYFKTTVINLVAIQQTVFFSCTSKLLLFINFVIIQYKKSKLMLMRCVKASSSSCLQAVLVYLHSIHHNSLFCSKKSQKVTKTLYFWGSRSFKVIDVNTTSPVLVMINSMCLFAPVFTPDKPTARK